MNECPYCRNTFEMNETCSDEFRMWQGLQGPYYIPDVDAVGNLSWTNTGDLPNPDTVNISGRIMTINGIVESVEDLPESAGEYEVYLVGEEEPFSGYIWDDGEWVDLGLIGKGEKGDKGDPGVDPATAAPAMDGTAAVGSSVKYAREDHVHPHDSAIATLRSDAKPTGTYQYYHVDCVHGSDDNDGITAPFKTLDKLFSIHVKNDLRVYFDAAGTYPTSVQFFSGMSMHLVKPDSVTGDVTISFTSVLSNDAIQFYNCYVHFKSVKVAWAASKFYFDNSGIMAESTDFVTGTVGFNTSNLYFEGSSAYALDIRESKAKLHDLSLTCPATDGSTYTIYCRDGELLIYGTFAYNQITATNETALIRVLRGRAKIAVTPSGASGHKYGLDLSSCDAEVTDAVLNAFASVAASGNTISGTTTLNTQTSPKTSGNTADQFVMEEYTIGTSVAVAADTFGTELSYTATKAGYYPVGVVGWRFSGSGSTRLIAARLRLSAQSAGSATVSMNPYNITDTATTSVSAYASVLWVKI